MEVRYVFSSHLSCRLMLFYYDSAVDDIFNNSGLFWAKKLSISMLNLGTLSPLLSLDFGRIIKGVLSLSCLRCCRMNESLQRRIIIT